MTSFSFVSTEIGIPFATSIGALTIFNCSATVRYVKNGYTGVFTSCFVSSCVECLVTERACGWCLYGGFCSGISDPCPIPTGVNNSYLMVHASHVCLYFEFTKSLLAWSQFWCY